MEDNSKIREKKCDTALKIIFIWWRPELLTCTNKKSVSPFLTGPKPCLKRSGTFDSVIAIKINCVLYILHLLCAEIPEPFGSYFGVKNKLLI